MAEFTLLLTISTHDDPEALASIVMDYLTGEDAPLWQDYGPNAWGGYDGPKIDKIEVRRSA